MEAQSIALQHLELETQPEMQTLLHLVLKTQRADIVQLPLDMQTPPAETTRPHLVPSMLLLVAEPLISFWIL